MFISIENKKPKNKNQVDSRKLSTLFIKDRASIFGINGVVSMSNDFLSNLQPSYYLNGGMGRKSKFSSMFNIRKEFNSSKTTTKDSKKYSELTTTALDFSKINLMENVFSLDNFLRETTLFQIRKSKAKIEPEVHTFSFRNIFNCSNNNSGNTERFCLSERDLFSARRTILDSRAKKSSFIYDTPGSLLSNSAMEVNPNSKEQEDLPFMNFFFEVSNSDMLQKMERFLVNYLTLSKEQRESFKKSTLRRQSLQSVLSILKKSENSKKIFLDNEIESGLTKQTSIRNRSKARHGQTLREKLLKSIFKMEKKIGKSRRSIHKSLEPRFLNLKSQVFR